MSYFRAAPPLILSLLICGCSGHSRVEKPPVATDAGNGASATGAPKAQLPGGAGAAPTPPVVQAGEGIADRFEVRAFIAEMSRKHGFSEAELRRTFQSVGIQEAILAAMARPYEAKPWYAYKKLFLTETRIRGGVEFRQRNAQSLADAERKYGVSPDIVTAIIGIESSYGQKPGNYRVIDALSTLAFAYPKRSGFFRGELEQFLLLCREEGMSPLQPVGSYAGAMGMPQFMPSSYLKLAADGDGDGRRDIWNNPADAIASVARYFAANGWRNGEPVAAPAGLGEADGVTRLSALEVAPSARSAGQLKSSLVKLDEETGPAYWHGYHNFNVIMRYNHSPLYAMAAYELSRKIAAGGAGGGAP